MRENIYCPLRLQVCVKEMEHCWLEVACSSHCTIASTAEVHDIDNPGQVLAWSTFVTPDQSQAQGPRVLMLRATELCETVADTRVHGRWHPLSTPNSDILVALLCFSFPPSWMARLGGFVGTQGREML